MHRGNKLLRTAFVRCAAFVFTAFFLYATSAAAQARPAGVEEGIVAVAARDLPVLTYVVLQDSSGTLLMPLLKISETLGITTQRPDSFHVLIPRSDRGYTTLDLRAHTISGGGRSAPYSPAEVIAADGDVYVTAERLGELLQATATLDAPTLTVVLVREPPFPAQQKTLIDQRRALLIARQHNATAATDVAVPYHAITGPGVLDWEASTSSLDPTKLLQLRLRGGAAVLGGSLTLGGATFVGRDRSTLGGNHDITAHYQRVFPTARYVTQAEAGDLISAGLFARFMRGVQITNAPPQRNYNLGEILLRPDLPAGWEYEVLQNGQLIGFSDAVTREAVAVPLHTGSSPVSVRMYGPGGQQVESRLLYQTPTTLLQKGRFEYAASVGKCTGDVCTRYGQLDARYAHWTRLTLGAGMEYLADSTGSAVRPYALGSFTTGTFMTGEVQLMPDAVYRGSFEIFPGESATGTLTAGLSMPGFGRVSVLPDTRSRWDFDAAYDQRLPNPFGPFRSLRAGAGGQAQTDGTQSRVHLSVGSSLRAGYAELRWESGDITDDMLTARASMLLQNVTLPLAIHPLVDGGFGLTHDGLALFHVGVAAQHDLYGAGSLGAEWVRGSKTPRLTLSWSRTFRGVQAVARSVAGGDHNATSTVSLRGAVSVAPNGDVATGAYAREGYGGIYGVVFIDRDGNGEFSKGDEPIPGATIIIGDTHVSADDNGRYHAWSLLPYAPMRITLDSTGTVDPGLVTSNDRLLARPVPNTSIKVDMPLLETRELAGSILAAEGVPTAAGITVELVPANGGPILTTSTYADGQFYISRVRPGHYTARVSRSSLEAVHASAEPATIPIDVPVTGKLDLITVPDITLKPVPPGGGGLE